MSKKIKNWDRIFHMLYSLGASVVILGVVGKLSRFSWGDYLLYFGLTMEAVIFFISAFQYSNSKKENLSLDHFNEIEGIDNYNSLLNKEVYEALKKSLEGTKIFNEQIKDLSKKIASLNQAYQSMLLAMSQTNFLHSNYDASPKNQRKNDCPDLPSSHRSCSDKHRK